MRAPSSAAARHLLPGGRRDLAAECFGPSGVMLGSGHCWFIGRLLRLEFVRARLECEHDAARLVAELFHALSPIERLAALPRRGWVARRQVEGGRAVRRDGHLQVEPIVVPDPGAGDESVERLVT